MLKRMSSSPACLRGEPEKDRKVSRKLRRKKDKGRAAGRLGEKLKIRWAYQSP